MSSRLGLALLAALIAGQAAAQDGRFQIERMGGQVVRLDRLTGAIDLCSLAAPSDCKALVPPSEVTVSQGPAGPGSRSEIAALEARVAELERRLQRIAALAGEAPEPEGSILDDPEAARRDIDRAFDLTAYALDRFRGLVEGLGE